MRLHPLLRLLPVRLQNRMPLDFVVIEEAVRRYRFAPTVACLRHTGRRVSRHSFHQKPRSLVQARVAQVQLLEFRLRPGRRFGEQGVRSKAESKRETPTVYKRGSMSLKVNELSRRRGATARLCITTCAKGYRAYEKMRDLMALSLKLAHTPCSPLYKGPVFPDRALKAIANDSDLQAD